MQLVGLKEQEEAAGNPEQLKPTGCVVPEINVAVSVVLIELPCITLTELGLREMEKSKVKVEIKFAV